MKIRAAILSAVLALAPLAADAQSNYGFTTGQVPTATQWNGYFSGKLDFPATSGVGIELGNGVGGFQGGSLDSTLTLSGTTLGLTNTATTVNGVSCVLGSTCTVTTTATGVFVGTTSVDGGTTGHVLYDNAGILGELATSGSGSVVLATGPSLVTPTLGVASATSINKVAITAPASASTLTIADGKTLTDTSGVGASILLGATGGGFTAYAGTSSAGNVLTGLSAAGAGSFLAYTNANTASTLVERDGSGNFSAGTITANLTGTASAAPLGGITGFGTGIATALGINTGSAGAPVLFNGNAGTPSALVGTNISGTAASLTAGAVARTGITGLGTGVATALGVNVGSAGAPVLFNGALGTPSSGTLTSATGLPISTGLTGAGTGILAALAVNTGSAGAPVLFNGALGTPSSGTLTNATGLPLTTGITGNLSPSNGGKPANRYTNFTTTTSYANNSTSQKMAGFGSSWTITPSTTGRIRVRVTGYVSENNVGGSPFFQLMWHAGTAPAQGDAITGTSGNGAEYELIGLSGTVPFAIEFEATGLTLSTAIWVDLATRSVTVGTVTIVPLSVVIEEF